MESRRQQKVARLLQKEVADIFQKEDSLKYKNVFITVTTVRVTSDLGIARIYLSIFPSNTADNVIKEVQLREHEIRHELASRLRHNMRKTPELHFYVDDSLDYAERIDELLK